INLNALANLLAAGTLNSTKAYKLLSLLPNMTDDVAYSIIDWLDNDSTPGPQGGESDYYNGQSPPYSARTAPWIPLRSYSWLKGLRRSFSLAPISIATVFKT